VDPIIESIILLIVFILDFLSLGHVLYPVDYREKVCVTLFEDLAALIDSLFSQLWSNYILVELKIIIILELVRNSLLHFISYLCLDWGATFSVIGWLRNLVLKLVDFAWLHSCCILLGLHVIKWVRADLNNETFWDFILLDCVIIGREWIYWPNWGFLIRWRLLYINSDNSLFLWRWNTCFPFEWIRSLRLLSWSIGISSLPKDIWKWWIWSSEWLAPLGKRILDTLSHLLIYLFLYLSHLLILLFIWWLQ